MSETRAAGERLAPMLNWKEIVEHAKEHGGRRSGLYTRTGDKGLSSLFTGERRSKTDDVFEALGTCDELNATVGVAQEHCRLVGNGLEDALAEIMSRLLDVGAALATPRNTSTPDKAARTRFPLRCVHELEALIDDLDGRLPPLTGFILPSGGLAATHLHMARVVCRRAERAAIPLLASGKVDEEVGMYLNRLSDFFFAAARYAAMTEGHEELKWAKMTMEERNAESQRE